MDRRWDCKVLKITVGLNLVSTLTYYSLITCIAYALPGDRVQTTYLQGSNLQTLKLWDDRSSTTVSVFVKEFKIYSIHNIFRPFAHLLHLNRLSCWVGCVKTKWREQCRKTRKGIPTYRYGHPKYEVHPIQDH